MTRSPTIFKRGSLRLVHGVFCAALVIRLVALARLTTSTGLNPAGGDMLFYHEWALRILGGQLVDHHAFYGLPFYAYWLAAIYKLFGVGAFVPLLLQAVADAFTAALVYKVAFACFGDRLPPARVATAVAALACAGWILFVPAEASAVVLMPTTFGMLAFWFAVWSAIRPEVRLTAERCALVGFSVGLAATAVGNVLVVLPLLLVAIVQHFQSRARIRAAAALVTGVLLGTAPCWAHNYFVARDPVFLSAHSGVNFWIGNNPDANGYPHFPGLRTGQPEMLSDSIAVPEAAAGHTLRRSEVSAYWSAKARQYVATQPLASLRLLARKFVNFWNAFEYDDLGVIAQLRRENVITPGLHFGIVAALGIPGMLLAWRVAPRSRWIAFALLLAVASVLSVFVTERYRLVAAPALLLFGAFGLVEFWRALVARNFRRIAIYAAAVIACATLVSIPQRDASLWALLAYNAGRQALDANDLGAAEQELERARAYVPDNPEVNFALGNLRVAQGNSAAAERFYIATLTVDRRHKGALTNMGVLALDQKKFDTADLYFRTALRYAPEDAKIHFLLARTLFMKGERAAAATEADRAVTLNPRQTEFVRLRDEIESAAR